MGEHDLLAPSRVGSPRGPRSHDGTIIPDAVDAMWGTDLTTTWTGEGQAAVFVAVDHCSAECVGIHAALRATRFEALEPIRQGVRERFGAFARDIADGLKLRHDHGSQYLADDFRAEIAFLGIASSPAFVREPEGNGCAEQFVRTLTEQLLDGKCPALVRRRARTRDAAHRGSDGSGPDRPPGGRRAAAAPSPSSSGGGRRCSRRRTHGARTVGAAC